MIPCPLAKDHLESILFSCYFLVVWKSWTCFIIFFVYVLVLDYDSKLMNGQPQVGYIGVNPFQDIPSHEICMIIHSHSSQRANNIEQSFSRLNSLYYLGKSTQSCLLSCIIMCQRLFNYNHCSEY